MVGCPPGYAHPFFLVPVDLAKKLSELPRSGPRQVKISGQENLPQKSEACVYVANHQSFMDILSVYQLHGGKS